jgi:hypothetical protein
MASGQSDASVEALWPAWSLSSQNKCRFNLGGFSTIFSTDFSHARLP